MSQITQGNRLYLYQLLSRELGVGKQTKLEQVESTLAADDILPQDLDCADTRELMGALDGIVRVTVFKRGRVYVTVLPNPEYDAYLQAPEEEKAPRPRKQQGRKAWKQKRTAKIPRPAKPKPKSRVQEPEPEPDTSTEDVAATSTTEPAITEAVAAPEPATSTPAQTETAEQTQVAMPDTAKAVEPKATTTPVASDVTSTENVAPQVSETGEQPDTSAHEAAHKEPVANTQTQASQSKPVSVPAPAAETTEVQTPATMPAVPAPEAGHQDVPAVEAAGQAAPAAPEVPVAPIAAAGEMDRPEAVPADEIKAEQEPMAGILEVNAPIEEEPSPTAEIPVASEEGLPAVEISESAETGVTAPADGPLFYAGTHTNIRLVSMPDEPESTPVRQRIFPDSFALEVRLENEPLSALYSILPFDVDPTALLDEDWRFSESIESYTYEDARLRFPLRYLRSDDQPVVVTLKRVAPGTTGKRWLLEDVNIGDETSLWGLPVADEGAWSHLSDAWRRPHTLVSPRRELARFAHLGKPHDLLESLASIAEQEWWGDDYEILSDYLAITFWRAKSQSKIAVSLDGSHAALDTGLVSPVGEPILMHFEERTGKVPWTFDHFGSDDQGLTPEPPTYVSELSHITLKAGAGVRLSREVARSHGDAITAQVEQAVRYAVRNHRVATPAFDPQTDEIRLLVPIHDDEGEVRALVLAPDAVTGYIALSVMSREAAYACARAVSAEQPSWLRPR